MGKISSLLHPHRLRTLRPNAAVQHYPRKVEKGSGELIDKPTIPGYETVLPAMKTGTNPAARNVRKTMPGTTTDIPARERLIYALDVATITEAKHWVERLEDQISFFKVGLQLFLAGGLPMVDWLTARGHQVMLDLKFFDIPATVAKAVAQVAGRGVTFTTVHGNDAIIEAAIAARGDVKILGITVLTNFSEDDLRHMGLTGTIEELVFHRAQKAVAMGCDGLVSSPLEAARLRRELGDDFFIVTPGIRPGGENMVTNDDQQRVATATQAIANGADYIVVGRPIRDAAEPLRAAAAIQADIAAGLASRGQTGRTTG